MTTLFAYIDVRPLLFLAGLPLFILIAIAVSRLVGSKAGKSKVALVSALVFSLLFVIFLTSLGPFVGRKEFREYPMTWEIKPPLPGSENESEVVFSFVDFPEHHFAEFSDELAEHLRASGTLQVKVVFEVTTDYGKIRGYRQKEIDGLQHWHSTGGYGGSRGDPRQSPWER